ARRFARAAKETFKKVDHNSKGDTMTKDRKRFRGISRAVLTATSLASGAALAQGSEPANTPESQSGADRTVEEIVVTGTSIKGAAPVGSNLVSVGVVDLEK